jgi:hypothetical protein
MTDTWTGGTAYTAIQMNVTDTSSTAGSLLMDLQKGGVSQFVVSKLGQVQAGDGAASLTVGTPGISFIGAPQVGFRRFSTTGAIFTASGADIWLTAASNIVMRNNGSYCWSSTTDPSVTPDSGLARAAAKVVKVTDGSSGVGYLQTPSTTVASLLAAATAGAGTRSFVTDATATTFLSTVAGGGANKVPVVSDGTNWLIG